MGSKLTKFLNVLTFGHLNRKAKKLAQKQAENKNSELTLNTVNLPNISAIVDGLGGKDNISNITATISTLTVYVKDASKLNFVLLKQHIKGVIKATDHVTLLVGDCAQTLKSKILE